MAWTLINSLDSLRNEFNTIAPRRDKGADGSIGDSAHTSSSDHTPDEDSSVLRDHDADHKNEVHALDIDSSGPWPNGRSFRSIVMTIIDRERSKWLSRTDRCRLKYVIYDGKIYSQSSDFEPRNYEGSDPHTNHAHFSGRYETACENDTRPWGVVVQKPEPEIKKEWDEMATKDDLKAAIREVLVERRPYFLKRISDRGWSDLSVDGKLDYLLESLVAAGQIDADADGQVDDTATLQGRLDRVEGQLAEILRRLPGESTIAGQ